MITNKNRNTICGVFFSSGNRKMGFIPSFSTMPGPASEGGSCDEENCKYCYNTCYAKNHCSRANPTYKANQKIAEESPMTVFEAALEFFNRPSTPRFFRWFVSGDFISQKFLYTVLRVCLAVPEVLHLAFSKRFSFVEKCISRIKKVSNLSLILSGWRGMPIPKRLLKHFVFSWVDDGGTEYWKEKRPEGYNFQYCPGNCDACGFCWKVKREDNTDVVFHKH